MQTNSTDKDTTLIETAPPLQRPFEGFRQACAHHPDQVALEICQPAAAKMQVRYAELDSFVRRLSRLLVTNRQSGSSSPRIGVLASRSLCAYGGSLAVLASGATMVALNPAYPASRNAEILRRAGVELLLVGEEGLPALQALQATAAKTVRCVIAPCSSRSDWALGWQQALDSSDLQAAATLTDAEIDHINDQPLSAEEAQLAYIVFTSGSTGQPKGVAISHGNLAVYMRNFRTLAAPEPSDRVATTYELSFDVALHDMLNAWWSGATLVVVPERALLAPARFIIDQHITVWFSVASLAMLMQKQGVLQPGQFAHLRHSLLCGEALPMATAMAWAAAAPNSTLYNVYGPTETTMELAFYRWQPGHSESHCQRGVVPIGVPFAGHRHLLMDEENREVVGAGTGELYIQGPQVGQGYWADAEQTARCFITMRGRSGRWYKTGDRVARDTLGVYHFIGRVDLMVKVRGHRIELGEVEHALRHASGVDLVAVIPQPAAKLGGTSITTEQSAGLAGFISAPCAFDGATLHQRLQPLLPKAMWLDEIHVLATLPLSVNRKIDRTALAQLLLQLNTKDGSICHAQALS